MNYGKITRIFFGLPLFCITFTSQAYTGEYQNKIFQPNNVKLFDDIDFSKMYYSGNTGVSSGSISNPSNKLVTITTSIPPYVSTRTGALNSFVHYIVCDPLLNTNLTSLTGSLIFRINFNGVYYYVNPYNSITIPVNMPLASYAFSLTVFGNYVNALSATCTIVHSPITNTTASSSPDTSYLSDIRDIQFQVMIMIFFVLFIIISITTYLIFKEFLGKK